MISGKSTTQFLELVNPKSVSDIITSENPSIIRIVKDDGETVAKALMRKLILDMLDFFMLGKSMGVNQVESTIELIFEAYGQYKFDDWKLCFKMAKLGQFGPVYDRIDGNVIFDWFDKYLEVRIAGFEAARAKENRLLNEAVKSDPTPMPDYIKELYAKKDIKKQSEIKPLNQSETQRQVNDWIKDFDALWVAQGSQGGKRFVMYEDIKMDIGEFLEYKAG